MRPTLLAVQFAICCLLISCAKPSVRPPTLPPDLCTPVSRAAPMPEGASIVQPVTPAERVATALFLNWVSESLGTGDQNADRAERAVKEGC